MLPNELEVDKPSFLWRHAPATVAPLDTVTCMTPLDTVTCMTLSYKWDQTWLCTLKASDINASDSSYAGSAAPCPLPTGDAVRTTHTKIQGDYV